MRIRRRDVLKAVAAPLVASATRAFGFTQVPTLRTAFSFRRGERPP